jgi:predicted nucleic acid-binding protein
MSHNYVVDASVGIKLFVVEDGSDLAVQLFAQLTADPPAQLYVPDLFFIECTNILWKYVWRFDYPAENARQDVIDLRALALITVSTADLIEPALDLALQYELTAYDASYVALAERLALPLVTADAPLARKLAGSSITVYELDGIEI